MMRKTTLYIALLSLVVSVATSCEGFLDTIPTDKVIGSTATKTLHDAKVAVNGLYVDMKYSDYYGTLMQLMGDERGDNIQPAELATGWPAIYTLQYEPESNSYFEIWDKCYNIIMRANTLLANLDNMDVTPSEQAIKNDFIGQAYAVRALVYFDIARLYGYPYLKDNGASLGAVIIDKLTPASESKLPRSTVAETYKQVFDDLELALPLLSKDKNSGHFNYWAAKMLQARAYLYKGEWQPAYLAAKEVIEDSPYQLVSREEYIAHFRETGSPETILELFVSPQSGIDSDGGYRSYWHNLWHGAESAGATLIPTVSWINLIESEAGDIRAQFIDYTSTYHPGKAWFNKFPGNNGENFRFNNPKLFRLAEAYLIAAEGALKGEAGAVEASKYLNAIRKRANATVGDVTATDQLIQIERRKELIGEGHRFFDEMRLGNTIVREDSDGHNFAESAGCPAAVDWNYHKVVLPISHTQRKYYPELQQNPQYNQ